MGGLGSVALELSAATPNWPWTLVSRSSNPVIACLASQYAGWRLSQDEGADKFFALGSGPASRARAPRAAVREARLRGSGRAGDAGAGKRQSAAASVVAKVAHDCGLAPDALTFIYAPTQSLTGSVQVVARVLEVALAQGL